MVEQDSWANTGDAAVDSWGKPTSVDEVDKRLEEWISAVLGEVTVSLAAPKDSQTAKGVNLYLLDLLSKPSGRSVKEPSPHKIVLRYLVTVWETEPRVMHRMLGELMFAALALPEVEVELEPLSPAVWSTLSLAARPAFVLRAPLLRERSEQKLVPLVRTPMVVKSAAIWSLSGFVRGPGDVAILGARVELPALNLFTATDLRGRFHFPTVPSEPPVKFLRVKARGHTISVPVQRPEEAIIIQLQEREI